ncbi:L51-S25-CI-B8 domain-containing protein [Favolaschia claudopus]|uniref:L51-S25-CI-B8 domain-containing protein n=1 Tax=Favolaschia claudopus TaxID=2862362 RepID=A0AAW0DVR4_9AGAR
MGRRLPQGPSDLSRLVANLRVPPRLTLPSVSSLKLTLAARNDHFGARHFLKEQLPRIRFANPDLEIQIRKMNKRREDDWRPELQVVFRDGQTRTWNLHGKWSTQIIRELMDDAAPPSWERWKAEAARTGVPLIPGAENEPATTSDQTEPRFSFDEWLRQPRKIRRATAAPKATTVSAAQTKPSSATATSEEGLDAADPLNEEERKAAKKEARRAKLDAPRLAQEEAEKLVALELLNKPRTGAAAVLP